MNEEQVLKKLEEYFENRLLKILDSGSVIAEKRGGYYGVTLNYLEKYVVPNVKRKILINSINSLLEDRIISNCYCRDIKRLVFEKCNHIIDHTEYPITLATFNSSTDYIHDEK